MKKLFISILVSFLVITALSAASFSKEDNIFPVETEVINLQANTYFIYHQINKIEIVNADRKAQKQKLDIKDYFYDKKTGRITFLTPLPYENCIVKLNGVPGVPYSCYLQDFNGNKEDLLVILNNMVAIEKKDYVYDPKTKMLTFRPDIDISHSSYYMVYYVQTENGVISKTISNDFNDTIAELQAVHNQNLFGGPLVIYKDRTGVSTSKVSKEVGFKIKLSHPESITICETYENNQKSVVVYCVYKDKFVEYTQNKVTEYLQ